jgi:outer membrane protein
MSFSFPSFRRLLPLLTTLLLSSWSYAQSKAQTDDGQGTELKTAKPSVKKTAQVTPHVIDAEREEDDEDDQTTELKNSKPAEKESAGATGIEAKRFVGLELDIEPEYAGASEQRLSRFLVFDYQNKNGFFVSTLRGIGYAAINKQLSWSGALTYRGGRTESSNSGSINDGSDALRGMGDVPGSLTLDLNAEVDLNDQLSATLETEFALTNQNTGNFYSLGLAYSLLDSSKDQLDLSLIAGYGDANYSQTNFGVTARQSRRSGYAIYAGKAGFEHLAATLEWEHTMNGRWSALSSLELKKLLSNAANSPVTHRKGSATLKIALLYAY